MREYVLQRLLGSVHVPKPQYVDPLQVVIPVGWDTRNKIGLLNNGFDCAEVQRAWEEQQQGNRTSVHGALAIYSEAVPKPESQSEVIFRPVVTCEDEQVLYERYFASLKPKASPKDTNAVLIILSLT